MIVKLYLVELIVRVNWINNVTDIKIWKHVCVFLTLTKSMSETRLSGKEIAPSKIWS